MDMSLELDLAVEGVKDRVLSGLASQTYESFDEDQGTGSRQTNASSKTLFPFSIGDNVYLLRIRSFDNTRNLSVAVGTSPSKMKHLGVYNAGTSTNPSSADVMEIKQNILDELCLNVDLESLSIVTVTRKSPSRRSWLTSRASLKSWTAMPAAISSLSNTSKRTRHAERPC